MMYYPCTLEEQLPCLTLPQFCMPNRFQLHVQVRSSSNAVTAAQQELCGSYHCGGSIHYKRNRDMTGGMPD